MRGWGVVVWIVILVAVSAFGALMGVLVAGLGGDTGPPYPATWFTDPSYGWVIPLPPGLVVAGALVAWRRRDYSWLIWGAGLAAAATILISVLPSIFTRST